MARKNICGPMAKEGIKIVSGQAFVAWVKSGFWGWGRHLISDLGRGGGVSHELNVTVASRLPMIYPGSGTQSQSHSRKIKTSF